MVLKSRTKTTKFTDRLQKLDYTTKFTNGPQKSDLDY
jgi:hypothetical protein